MGLLPDDDGGLFVTPDDEFAALFQADMWLVLPMDEQARTLEARDPRPVRYGVPYILRRAGSRRAYLLVENGLVTTSATQASAIMFFRKQFTTVCRRYKCEDVLSSGGSMSDCPSCCARAPPLVDSARLDGQDILHGVLMALAAIACMGLLIIIIIAVHSASQPKNIHSISGPVLVAGDGYLRLDAEGKSDIHSISGPVSMYVLHKPGSKHKQTTKHPVFLLFGDKHFSRENACEPCTCPTATTTTQGPSPRRCCVKLTDVEEFIQPLDELAQNYGPFDIYAERMFLPQEAHAHVQKNFLGDFIGVDDKRIDDCYLRGLRKTSGSTTDDKCQTSKKIRWHGGDVRQTTNKT